MPNQVVATEGKTERPQPMTVLSAKVVDLALVSYADESGFVHTQLAMVGDNNVRLIDGKIFGLSKESQKQGPASDWIAKGVFEKLGRVKGV